MSNNVTHIKSKLFDMFQNYEIVEDCVEGADKIKEKGEQYLIKDVGTRRDLYNNYKRRANFLPATERTIDGFVGLLTRKNQTFNADDRFKDFIDNNGMDASGTSIFDYTKQELIYKIMYGRVGKFVDYLEIDEVNTLSDLENSRNRPVASIYSPRSIINWKYQYGKLSLVVLEEDVAINDPDNIFRDITIKQYRVLRLDENGLYIQEIYRKNQETKEYEVFSSLNVFVNNRRLSTIPFIIENYDGTHPDNIPKPPLLDLCSINISHYNNSADLEASIHIANQATMVLKLKPKDSEYDEDGEEIKPQPFVIGSSYVNVIENDEDFQIVESSGAGIERLRTIMQDKVNDMAKIGARFLQNDKNVAESFETEYIRRSGEFSMLSSIANSSSQSTQKILEMMNYWQFGGIEEVEFKIHSNFNMQAHTTEELNMMLQGVINGKVALDDLYKALKRNDLVDKTRDIEDVREMLEQDRMYWYSSYIRIT